MSASSRHSRTSFVVAMTWSASVWRRVGGLGHLQEQARREDALMVEPREMDGLDAGQFVDRWHGRHYRATRQPAAQRHATAVPRNERMRPDDPVGIVRPPIARRIDQSRLRLPRISPVPNAAVWTLAYVAPLRIARTSSAYSVAAIP